MTPIINDAPNLAPVYAEIFLLIAASAILLIDMFLKGEKRTLTYVLSLLTLVGCAFFTFVDYNAGTTTYTFHNMYVSDPMGNLLKLFTYLAVGVTLIYSRQYATERGMTRRSDRGAKQPMHRATRTSTRGPGRSTACCYQRS